VPSPPQAGEGPTVRDTMFGRRFWTLAAIAAVLLALMGATAAAGGGVVAFPSAYLNAGIAPVEVLATRTANAVTGFFQGIADLWSLRDQNAAYRAEISALQAQLLRDGELKAENANLSALVHLQTSVDAEGLHGIAASVIGRSPDSWFNSLVVNKGTSAGVQAGMVAVTPNGLVGRVEPGVSAHAAQVMLLTNPAFGVGILVQRSSSREEGVAVGRLSSPDLTATFFSATANVRPGDELLTSGLGGGFPSGLAVGTVERVAEGDFGLVRQATVVPAAHLQSVEEVLLLPASGNGAG